MGDEMEFEWHLNWWYRPNQLNDFETSVADYYDCFCDWKDSMVINSCPACEADYVAAFIQNLRCDIRSRLESKGRPRTRRLSDAFYDAKLEECLISMEEAFKKFEAHKPDEVVQSSCSNVSVENLLDDEFSGLEYDESLCLEGGLSISEDLPVPIDLEKKTRKLFGELNEPNLGESPSIDQVLGNVSHVSATADVTTTEKAGDVYEDELVLKSEVKQGLKQFSVKFCPIYPVEKVELLTPKAEVQFMNMAKELVSAEIRMVKVAYQVFDEMSRSSFVEPKEEISGAVDHVPLIDCVPQVFDPGTSISFEDIVAVFMLNTPLSSLRMCEHDTVYIRVSAIKNESILLFDPGGCSCHSTCCRNVAVTDTSHVLKGIENLDDAWNCKSCEVSTSISTEILELDVEICVGKVLYVTFDPGGNLLHHQGCSFFKLNSVMQSFYFRLNELDSARVYQCWTDFYSRHENDQVHLAFGECKNVIYFTCYDALFLFDPGGRKKVLHILGSNQHKKVMVTVLASCSLLGSYKWCDPFAHNISCHSSKRWFGKLDVELVCMWGMLEIGVTLMVLHTIVGLTIEGNESHISRNFRTGRVSSWRLLTLRKMVHSSVVEEVYQTFDKGLNLNAVEQIDDMKSQLLPPTMAWLRRLDFDFLVSKNVRQDLDIIPGTSLVGFWLARVSIFTFDPGGGCICLVGTMNANHSNRKLRIKLHTALKVDILAAFYSVVMWIFDAYKLVGFTLSTAQLGQSWWAFGSHTSLRTRMSSRGKERKFYVKRNDGMYRGNGKHTGGDKMLDGLFAEIFIVVMRNKGDLQSHSSHVHCCLEIKGISKDRALVICEQRYSTEHCSRFAESHELQSYLVIRDLDILQILCHYTFEDFFVLCCVEIDSCFLHFISLRTRMF